jgi:RNA polymerase sigma factor (sigma-70 family)
MTNLTDWELVRLFREHPGQMSQAWLEWLRRHGRVAVAVAAKVLRNWDLPMDLAEDALQQGSLQFLGAVDRLDPTRPPRPYFLRTVHNAAVSLVRVELRQKAVLRELPAKRTGAEVALARRETVERLLGAVPVAEREILAARYLEGLSAGEIAARRGVSVAVIYRQLHRGRCMLRGPTSGAAEARP